MLLTLGPSDAVGAVLVTGGTGSGSTGGVGVSTGAGGAGLVGDGATSGACAVSATTGAAAAAGLLAGDRGAVLTTAGGRVLSVGVQVQGRRGLAMVQVSTLEAVPRGSP